MPIYEYRCASCGHKLETLQKFTEAPLSDCPVCGKSSLSKLVSVAGFQLKGSGWYATDFKNSGAKPAAKSDAGKEGESKPAEAKSASQGDTKSATTGEAATTAPPPAAATVPTANER